MTVVLWTLLLYCSLVLGVVFQGSSSATLFWMPDGIAVLAVLAMVTLAWPSGLWVAAGIGLLADLLWGPRLGLTTVCVVVVGSLLGGIRHWFDCGRPARSIAVTTFLAAMLLMTRYALQQWLIASGDVDWIGLTMLGTWEAVKAGLTAFALAWLVERTTTTTTILFRPAAG